MNGQGGTMNLCLYTIYNNEAPNWFKGTVSIPFHRTLDHACMYICAILLCMYVHNTSIRKSPQLQPLLLLFFSSPEWDGDGDGTE